MGTFFSWVLLILAVLVTLYALGQLVLLRGRKLIGAEVTKLEVWAMIAFPAVACVIGLVAVCVVGQSLMLSAVLSIELAVLWTGMLLQVTPLLFILDKSRERAAQIKHAVSTFNSKAV